MAYVPVPKDLSKVKTKVAFNLTKRQIVCFCGALLSACRFSFCSETSRQQPCVYGMIAVMLPCFLFAMYEKHGQPLEVVVKQHHTDKIHTAQRTTIQDNNFYSVLERQRKLEKEVSAIAKGNTKKQRGGKHKA